MDQALGKEGIEDDYIKSVKEEIEQDIKRENLVSGDQQEKKNFKEFHDYAVGNGVIVNKSKVMWENE